MADARLAALLGSDELTWLRGRVRERLARGMALTGTVVLSDSTLEQRAAVAGLLGTEVAPGPRLPVSLPRVSAALARAGMAADLGDAVVALEGPVPVREALREAGRAAWTAAAEPLEQLAAARPELAGWAGRTVRSGLLRTLAGSDVERAAALAESAAAVAVRLPAADVALARLASDVLGDAHALDLGRPVETLARGAAQALGGPPTAPGAEGRREVWARVGVLVDDLTSQVLVLGLGVGGGRPAGAVDSMLAAAREAGEPMPLTLGMLARVPPSLDGLRGRTVSVCENVTVVGAAAARHGPSCAPLVCTGGQPTVAVIRLLERLEAAGARLRYHGDFDWHGVRIANRVLSRVAAVPWRYDAAAYRAAALAAGPAAARLGGRPVTPSWEPNLGVAMRELGLKVEEEAVLDDLLTDLATTT